MKGKSNISENSELKRAEAFNKLVETHQQHQSVIQAALSNVDSIPINNKIVFDDDDNGKKVICNETVVNGHSTNRISSKKRLLESDEESETEIDFRVKKQYEGVGGQKLLGLKTKYHNDSRFVLDERFIEDNNNHHKNQTIDGNVDAVEVEKRKQLKILENILGKKTLEGQRKHEQIKQSMIRFDPSLPEHSKFIVPIESNENKIKKKKKKELELTNEYEKIEENQPIVSKEIFYKVDASLKDVFQEEKSFSLLNTFGQIDDDNESEQNTTTDYHVEELKQNKANLGANPFHYDSSTDEEDVMEDDRKSRKMKKPQHSNKNENKTRVQKWRTEPFFFEKNDYRLQEAEDFMKRIATEEVEENYREFRMKLKNIIKHKVGQSKKEALSNKLEHIKGKNKFYKKKKKSVVKKR